MRQLANGKEEWMTKECKKEDAATVTMSWWRLLNADLTVIVSVSHSVYLLKTILLSSICIEVVAM